MTKKVHATRVYCVLRFELVHQIAQIVWSILRRTPTAQIRRIRASQNDSLFFGEVLPLLDKRNTGSTRSMQRYDQWRRGVGLQSRRHVEVISSSFSLRGDEFLSY